MNGVIAEPRSRSSCRRVLRMNDAGAEVGPVAQAVVARVGLGEAREPTAGGVVERAAVDDRAADRRAVAADELGHRVHDDVGAPLQRAHEVRRRDRVVDDERHARPRGPPATHLRGRARRRGGWPAPRRRTASCSAATAARHCVEVVRIVDEGHLDADLGQRVVQEVVGAAVQGRRGDDVVAGVGQREDRQELGGLTGGDGEGTGQADGGGHAALQRVEASLQHELRRVGDAGVDVAHLRQPEQVRRVLGAVERVAGRLVDRHGPGVGRLVGRLPGVDLTGLESPLLTHGGGGYARNSRPYKSDFVDAGRNAWMQAFLPAVQGSSAVRRWRGSRRWLPRRDAGSRWRERQSWAPPEASATLGLPALIHGIMPRSSLPTTSIGCS